MSRRNKLIVAIVALGMALCLVLTLMPEPLHDGKPVAYWVDEACRGYDQNDVLQFRREVKDIGPAAVPFLIKKLRTGDGGSKAYLWLLEHPPPGLQRWLPDLPSAEEERYGAARTLAMLGADAKPAVPDLVRLLPGMENPALAALRAIGPGAQAALPALHTMLTNQNTSLRVEIAWALWEIGRETNKVLEICTNAMAPGVDEMNAGALLSELLTAAAPAAPFALRVLQDTNRLVATRSNAATVLGGARVSSPEILAALLDGMQAGQEVGFRANCAMALWRLDAHYAPLATRLVLESIIELKKRFPGNEQDFANWLEVRGLDPQQSIPALRDLLESPSPVMRGEAAEALRRVEAKSQTAGRGVEPIR